MDCTWVGLCDMGLAEQAAWVQAAGSVLAIFVAIWVSRDGRAHDEKMRRDSMRPHLTIAIDRMGNPTMLRLRVRNDGLGPAVVRRIQLMVDGNVMPGECFEPIRAAMAALGGVNGSGAAIQEGEWIPPGTEHNVLVIEFNELGDEWIHRDPVGNLAPMARRLSLRVDYESVFGEKFHARSGQIEGMTQAA